MVETRHDTYLVPLDPLSVDKDHLSPARADEVKPLLPRAHGSLASRVLQRGRNNLVEREGGSLACDRLHKVNEASVGLMDEREGHLRSTRGRDDLTEKAHRLGRAERIDQVERQAGHLGRCREG